MTYVDGFVLPLKSNRLEDYRKMAENAGRIWIEHGALEYKECVLEDMSEPDFCTTFSKTIEVKEDEIAVFAYIVFQSRAHRDEVNAKVMSDPRIKDACDPENMPFDVKRMAYGGFKTIVEY